MPEWQIIHHGLSPPALAYALGLVVALWLASRLRGEIRRRPRGWQVALVALRLGTVLLVTLLLAQPSLVLTRRPAEPGRLLVLLDDSQSMATRDPLADGQRLLATASALGLPAAAGRATPARELAATVSAALPPLAKLAAEARVAADTVATGLPASLSVEQAILAAPTTLAPLRQASQAVSDAEALVQPRRQTARELLARLPASAAGAPWVQLNTVAAWERAASHLADCQATAERLVAELTDEQTRLDEAFLASESRASELSGPLRALSRYDLARQVLAAVPALARAEYANLSQAPFPATPAPAAPQTDLVQPLLRTLDEHPLTLLDGVILVSDGGQNAAATPATLARYRQRGVPLLVLGVGEPRHEDPLRLVNAFIPPVAAVRTVMELELELSTSLPPATTLTLEARLADAVAAEGDEEESSARRPDPRFQAAPALPASLPMTVPGAHWHQRFSLQAPPPGRHTLLLELKDAAGEVLLRHAAPLLVLAQRPSVLLVAPWPDAFCRAVLAQRRGGARIYPLYHFGHAERPARGNTRDSLPVQPEDWSRYDLVIIHGGRPPTLTADDASALATQVRERGTGLLLSDDADGALRALLAPAFGWPAPALAKVAGAEAAPIDPRLSPAPAAAHLPILQLSGEIIANRNLWQAFAPPGHRQPVPPQDWDLFSAPPTGSLASLGLRGRGKLLWLGLGDYEPLQEWTGAQLEAWLSQIFGDLLTPLLPAVAEGEAPPSLGLYPPVPSVGQEARVLAWWPASAGPPPGLSASGPAGQTVTLGWDSPAPWLSARWTPPEPGAWTVTAGALKLTSEVRPLASAETLELSLNPAFLQDLARAAGGQYRSLADAADAVRLLPALTRERVETTVWRLSDHALALLLLMLVLVTADFVCRKFAGLAL